MELNDRIAPEIQNQLEGSVKYSVRYEISARSAAPGGIVVVTGEDVFVFENQQKILEIKLSSIAEANCEKLYGSGCLKFVLHSGEEKLAAVFSLSRFACFTALAQAIEYRLDTGSFPAELKIEQKFCPVCGSPLMHGSKLCIKCARKPKILLRLYHIGKPYLPRILLVIFFVVAVELLAVIYPYFKRLVIDNYMTAENPQISKIWLLFGLTAGIYLTVCLFEWIVGYLKNFVAAAVSRDLREMLFDKIQRLSLANITKRSAGDMLGRIQNDTTRVREFLVSYGADIIVRVFSLLLLTIILFVTNWRLAVLVTLPAPFMLWAFRWSSDKIQRKFHIVWRRGQKVNSLLHDAINGIRVVKAYGGEQNETRKFERVSTDYCIQLSGAEKFWSLVTPVVGFVMTLGEFLVLYFGANLVLQQEMQIGELVQYTTYVSMLYGPLRWLISLPRQIKQASVSANKLFEIIDEPEESQQQQNLPCPVSGDITFDNVSFGYKEYIPVLKHLNFTVKQGEMIGIVGASGVGKSTLINLLMRLYEPTRGEIRINGTPLQDIPRSVLRSKIGVVLQETFLFDGTVLDNIRYAKPDAPFEEIVKAAKAAGAHEFILRLPEAYHTRVGDRGYMLSGGERQRVAIARAILHQPDILILDEATSALDTKTEKQIQDTLGEIIKGRTTFAIAHRLSTLRQADKLLVLDKGKVAEFGTHIELLKNRSVYYRLVMAQRQTAKIRK